MNQEKKLITIYQALPSQIKLIMQVKSLVWHPLSVNNCYQLLNVSHFETPKGHFGDPKKAKSSIRSQKSHGFMKKKLSRFYPSFIQILSKFYPDFIQILSKFYRIKSG